MVEEVLNKDLLEEDREADHLAVIFLDNFKMKLFMHTMNKRDLLVDMEVLWEVL
jgi:hypothetical protein